MTSPPNVLCIVMDTVRAEDFPGGPHPVDRTPFLDRLRSESVVFERAVSPASWTIPSHASLFTGLYPWDHGVHNRRAIRLDPSTHQIAEILRVARYRSVSLSSNFLIGPESGLAKGFDLATWGEWYEGYFRGIRPSRPPHSRLLSDPSTYVPVTPRHGWKWDAVRRVAPLGHRFPGVLDAASRGFAKIRGTPVGDHGGYVSEWIEPTLAKFLQEQPDDLPVYAFVNLLEAHEPYFPDREIAPTFREWLRYSVVRQDRIGWLSQAWTPGPKAMDLLRALYRASIRRLDHRIAGIVKILQDAGRWENTLLVLTSDHGQALGEHDLLYHMLRVDEAEVRIPLWVRWPRGEHGGRTARGWASLVDVLPTVAEAAGIATPTLPDTVTLGSLLDAARPGPVLSVADGILSDPMLRHLKADRRNEFDRVWVAAYAGDRKVALDLERDEPHAYDVISDPGETEDLWPVHRSEFEPLVDAARAAGRKMLQTHAATLPEDIESRLRSWGYL